MCYHQLIHRDLGLQTETTACALLHLRNIAKGLQPLTNIGSGAPRQGHTLGAKGVFHPTESLHFVGTVCTEH